MTIYYRFEENEDWTICDSFENLVKLYNYNDIYKLDCSNNNLSVLPTLPNSLEYLDCSQNELNVLPNLPSSLTVLDCYVNKLLFLPTLPNSLTVLDCYSNRITILPTLNSLMYLYCYSNHLTLLPKFPDGLEYKRYHNNPVDTYIKKKCCGSMDIYHRVNEIFATKLVRWYLDCRENPEYLFCRTRLDKEYDDLMEEDIDGIMC